MAKTGGIKNRRNNLGRCSVCDGVEGKHVPSCSSQLKTSASPETPTARNVPSTETGITLVIKFLERLKCGLEEPDEIDEMIDVLRANNDLRYAAEEALVALSVFKITDLEKPYAEVSPTYRKQLLKAHDLLFSTLGKPGSEVHAGQKPTDTRETKEYGTR